LMMMMMMTLKIHIPDVVVRYPKSKVINPFL
jgi:hypothetical protein